MEKPQEKEQRSNFSIQVQERVWEELRTLEDRTEALRKELRRLRVPTERNGVVLNPLLSTTSSERQRDLNHLRLLVSVLESHLQILFSIIEQGEES